MALKIKDREADGDGDAGASPVAGAGAVDTGASAVDAGAMDGGGPDAGDAVAGAAQAMAAAPAGSSPIAIGRNIALHPDKPLPAYDTTGARAFHASHKREDARSLIALVCHAGVIPRLAMINVLKRMEYPHMPAPLQWEVIDWPAEGRRAPVIIIERPGGARLFPSASARRLPMPEEVVMREFIQPVHYLLTLLEEQHLVHRNIRADNLYYADPAERQIMLGECVSSPAGANNPCIYETLECCLAQVAGRGVGTAENDLYALGVVILILLTGQIPLAELDDDAITQMKMKQGSYATLTQGHRVSLTMMEPLRGLLHDNPRERWNLENLGFWLQGRRLSPKQQVTPARAARAFPFNGKQHWTARGLAQGLYHGWDQAAGLINDGTLETWLRRSLGGEEHTEAFVHARSMIRIGQSEPDPDQMVARCLIALHPDGPLRFRSLSVTLSGFQTVMAHLYRDQNARADFPRMILDDIVPFWVETQAKVDLDNTMFANRARASKPILQQTAPGSGLERLVYEMDPNLPCMSPLFARDYVPDLESMVPAFERLAAAAAETEADGDANSLFIDRDVAAFMAARSKRSLAQEFKDLSLGNDEPLARIAQVRLLAALQDTFNQSDKYPALCEAAHRLLGPAVTRFRSRSRRKRVTKELRKMKKTGRLRAFLQVIDHEGDVRQDEKMYRQAVSIYARSIEELIELKRDMLNRRELAKEIGGQLSGALSGLAGAATAILVLVLR